MGRKGEKGSQVKLGINSGNFFGFEGVQLLIKDHPR